MYLLETYSINFSIPLSLSTLLIHILAQSYRDSHVTTELGQNPHASKAQVWQFYSFSGVFLFYTESLITSA